MSIHEFVRNNDLTKVEEYISNGGDLNVIDKLKRTPLHLAAWNGNLDILSTLLKNNAALDIKAMDGFNPLHFAVQSVGPQAAECVRLLCKKGKSLGLVAQRVTKGNKTALHLAAPKGNIEIISILLEYGLDPVAKTGAGQTAIDLAKDAKIIRLLSEHVKGKGKSSAPTDAKEKEAEIGEDEKISSSKHPENEVEGGVLKSSSKEVTVETRDEEKRHSEAAPSSTISSLDSSSTTQKSTGPVGIASSIMSILQKRKDTVPTTTERQGEEKTEKDINSHKEEKEGENEAEKATKKPRFL